MDGGLLQALPLAIGSVHDCCSAFCNCKEESGVKASGSGSRRDQSQIGVCTSEECSIEGFGQLKGSAEVCQSL